MVSTVSISFSLPNHFLGRQSLTVAYFCTPIPILLAYFCTPFNTTTYIPVSYDMVVNENHGKKEKFVTVAHELAHLYCGHLGTINPKWWPDRRGLDGDAEEFEAESAAYLACKRVGIKSPSEEYLADYVKTNDQVPAISLDCIIKAATFIETMSRQNLPLRK